MSVVSSKQSDEELKVLTYAEDLLGYTFDICHREKTKETTKDGQKVKRKEPLFPKKYWACFTAKIIELASSAYDDLYWANEVWFDKGITEELYAERHSHQMKAIASLKSMLPKITFAWHRFSIATNSVECWTGMVVKTIQQAKKWIASDESRYREFKKK